MLARYNIRAVIALHALANLSIGVSLLLWTNLSAESVLSRYMPGWLWPTMFIVAGVLAVIGVWSRPFAQFAYAFAGVITAVFGVASVIAVIQTGNLAPVSSAVFLLYIAVMKFEIAYMIAQRDDIVQRISEATAVGQSVLEQTGEHGTNP